MWELHIKHVTPLAHLLAHGGLATKSHRDTNPSDHRISSLFTEAHPFPFWKPDAHRVAGGR
jgi:hypothetical protein